jgi:uncharacterized protein YidB (DUF937 family)
LSAFDLLKKQATDIMAQAMGRSTEAAPESAAGEHAFLTEVLDMLKSHGLGNLTKTFQEKGLGDVVNSWIGKGENLPVSPNQVGSTFGLENLEALAKKLGLPVEQVTAMLSKVLPQVVNKLTPNGLIEEPAAE